MNATIEKQTLEELIFQTEHACDGKIIEGEEWRSAYLLIDSLDRTLLTGDYPESISLHSKIRNRYQELEETLGDLHQKTKSWWSHPFTSIEDFNKQIEELSNWISEDEQRLFKNFSRETKKKATKELSNRNWERAVLHLSLSLGLELNYQLLGDRAYCLWKLGHNEASLRDFEKALSLNPVWEEGYLRLGNVHFTAGEYEKAIEVYEQGLQNLPETQRTAIEDTLAEAKHAYSQEKKLQGEIEYLSKRLAELGTNPSELTVEALLREFAERLRNSYETPARGCNQTRIVARLRAVITVIMHRCRFEGRGVVDSLELAREWSRYKERMIRFSLEAVMRVGAMILNDIDANLADSRLPTRFSRFQTLRASLWKALYRLYISPRIKETRNLLKEKLIFLLHITEADRSFDAIEERVSNLLETTCLELLVLPLLSLLQNEASLVELVTRKATRRSQRKHLVDEDGFTAILRDDIQRELEDLCSELAEFKYRQEQRRNEELPSSTSTASATPTVAAGEEERGARTLLPATSQPEVLNEAAL